MNLNEPKRILKEKQMINKIESDLFNKIKFRTFDFDTLLKEGNIDLINNYERHIIKKILFSKNK